MLNSRDLTLVIIFAVIGFVYSASIGQMGNLLVGINGLNYLLIMGQAIWVTIAFLFFNGKRWRLVFSVTLFGFLTLPTFLMGSPYDIIPRIPLILNSIQSDILMNTIYLHVKKNKMMLPFSIFFTVEYFMMDTLFRFLLYQIFYSKEYVGMLFGIVTLLLPVIVIECVLGSIIGYYIFKRIKKLN